MKKVFGMIAAIMLLTSCVGRSKYDEQVRLNDSLTAVNAAMQAELEGYKCNPEKLLATIKKNYEAKEYSELKANLDLLQRYHPEAEEYQTASSIYQQSLREQEAANKKAAAEAAKAEAERQAEMKPIERIMEKYNCDEMTATLIHTKRVKIGMTAEQCRAAWGRPQDINRTVGSYGVHEQWCYNGSYLYFEDGILTSYQN